MICIGFKRKDLSLHTCITLPSYYEVLIIYSQNAIVLIFIVRNLKFVFSSLNDFELKKSHELLCIYNFDSDHMSIGGYVIHISEIL
mgnify:CR=1 FL=1